MLFRSFHNLNREFQAQDTKYVCTYVCLEYAHSSAQGRFDHECLIVIHGNGSGNIVVLCCCWKSIWSLRWGVIRFLIVILCAVRVKRKVSRAITSTTQAGRRILPWRRFVASCGTFG